MNWLKRFNPFAASTLSNPSDELLQALLAGLSTAAGVTVTPVTALGVSTVFACINRIAGSLSSVPLELYISDGKNTKKAINHPVYRLVHDQPNEDMSSVDLRWCLQPQLSLRNNSYCVIVRNGLNEIVKLLPVGASDQVMLRRTNGSLFYDINGVAFRSDQVLHLRCRSTNGIQGDDTLRAVRDVIALAMVLQENAAKFFGNGSRPGAILESPNQLSDKAAKRLKESFEKIHKGDPYQVAVLEEGLKYVVQRTDNTDSQMVESRKQQDIAICQAFGVPPHKVGLLDKATFSNIEQQSIEYVTDTLLPICTTWEAALKMKLLTPQEQKTMYFKFNLAGLLRGDMVSRFNAYSVARNGGWMSANDVLELEERNPLEEGGDDYWRPANMLIVGEPVPQPAAGAPAVGTPPKAEIIPIHQKQT